MKRKSVINSLMGFKAKHMQKQDFLSAMPLKDKNTLSGLDSRHLCQRILEAESLPINTSILTESCMTHDMKAAILLLILGRADEYGDGGTYARMKRKGLVLKIQEDEMDAATDDLRSLAVMEANGIRLGEDVDFLVKHGHSGVRMLMGELGTEDQESFINGVRMMVSEKQSCDIQQMAQYLRFCELFSPNTGFIDMGVIKEEMMCDMVEEIIRSKRPSSCMIGTEERLRRISMKALGDEKFMDEVHRFWHKDILEDGLMMFNGLSTPGITYVIKRKHEEGYLLHSLAQEFLNDIMRYMEESEHEAEKAKMTGTPALGGTLSFTVAKGTRTERCIKTKKGGIEIRYILPSYGAIEI